MLTETEMDRITAAQGLGSMMGALGSAKNLLIAMNGDNQDFLDIEPTFGVDQERLQKIVDSIDGVITNLVAIWDETYSLLLDSTAINSDVCVDNGTPWFYLSFATED